MAQRSKTFSATTLPRAIDSPSTAFRYGQNNDRFGSIDYNDYGSMLEDERSISAPSDLGSLFILKPKVWRYWLLGVLAYTFAICLENVIIFPSLWPRLLMFCDQYDSDDLRYYLGVILAAFSAGRSISAILLNLREHTRQSMRIAGLLCFFLSLISSFLYTIAWSPVILIISRTLAGLGAGALTLLMSTLVSATSSEKRTSAIANFFIAAAVGEIVGPLIAYLTISVKFTVSDFQFDSFNLVGVWTFMIFCLTFPWAFRSFVANPSNNISSSNNSNSNNNEKNKTRSNSYNNNSNINNDSLNSNSDDGSSNSSTSSVDIYSLHTLFCTNKLISYNMLFIFLLALVNNAAVSSLETIVVPIGAQNFGFGVSENSIIFIISGFLLFFSNIVLVKVAACIRLDDNVGMYFSIIIALIGSLILFYDSTSLLSFIIGNVAYAIGIFCLLTFLSSMFTKSIRERPNFFIGILRASSAGIRVVGNLLAANTLTTQTNFQPCHRNNNNNGGGTNSGKNNSHAFSFNNNNNNNNNNHDDIHKLLHNDDAATFSPQLLLLILPFLMLFIAIVRSIYLYKTRRRSSSSRYDNFSSYNTMIDNDDDVGGTVLYEDNSDVSSLYRKFHNNNNVPSDTDDDSEIMDFDLIMEQDSKRNSFVS